MRGSGGGPHGFPAEVCMRQNAAANRSGRTSNGSAAAPLSARLSVGPRWLRASRADARRPASGWWPGARTVEAVKRRNAIAGGDRARRARVADDVERERLAGPLGRPPDPRLDESSTPIVARSATAFTAGGPRPARLVECVRRYRQSVRSRLYQTNRPAAPGSLLPPILSQRPSVSGRADVLTLVTGRVQRPRLHA